MLKKLIITLLTLGLALPLASAGTDQAVHMNKPLTFCGEAVPLKQLDVYRAVDQHLLLLAEAKSRVWLTLRRASRYQGLMEAELRNAGLPADLIYIPMAITGFAPEYNNAGRGPWRFREAEAKDLGLRMDGNIDERLDPVASTQAAARRLKELKAAYGHWTTAMAAHLVGDKPLSQTIAEAGGEQDYYKLYLPDGLDNLPSTVLAGKILFQDPAAFGYQQSAERAWPRQWSKRVQVPQASTARALAGQYRQDYKTFRDMNPHLLTGIVPAGVTVNIP
ncbi:MAG: transglycosylase SLT domain-containing protein [Candidatus Adiutrix sp.]|jgi:membrane-bound lytic murein transglycosylase D|nr:transglycosylase SLT domain-containing protein [Candidatus Adiutrix sp.]